MKKGMVGFLDIMAAFGMVALGGLMIYSSLLNKELGTQINDLIGNTPLIEAALGLLLILSVLLRLASKQKAHEKDRFINFEADGGSVAVSTKAIRDFIEHICKEFSAVKSIDSKLLKNKNAIDIAINIKVASGSKIPELSHMLQQRVRESVRESMGLEEIRNITITVQEIIGTPPPPPPSPSVSPPEPIA
jgi:uncharacterized alkaline shock family protein YloU